MSSVTYPDGQTLVSSALTPPQIETVFQLVTAEALGFNPPIQFPIGDATGGINSVSTQAGSPILTLQAALPIPINAVVSGPGIPDAAIVVSVVGPGVTISAAAIATAQNVPLLFSPEGATDASPAFSAVRVGWQQKGQPGFEISDDVCFLRATAEDAPYSQTRYETLSQNDTTSLIQNMALTQVWRIHWTFYGPNCFDHARAVISALSLDWVSFALQCSNIYVVPDYHRPIYAPELESGQYWQRADVSIDFNELVQESIIIPAAESSPVTITSDVGPTVAIDIVA